MASTLVHSATLVDAKGISDGWVLSDGRAIIASGSPETTPTRADRLIDASGCYVTPGFVDIHSHGAGGAHYQDSADSALVAMAAMRAHGTTRAVASFVTSSIADIEAAIATTRQAMARDKGLIGVHLEGPFLSPARRGAHHRELLCHPDRSIVDRLLDVGQDLIRQITLAPELPGALDAVERFVGAGVVVAIGHTECDYEMAKEAFARGASLVTHAFNAMAPIQGRQPGVLGAAIEQDHVTIEVIADGIHVHPASVLLLFASAPGRVALVTDSMAAAAAPPGQYQLGSVQVEASGDRAVVSGTNTLAGSTLTPDRALRTVVNDCGVPLKDGVAALTETPARAIGEKNPALLEPGAPAQLVILDKELAVSKVVTD